MSDLGAGALHGLFLPESETDEPVHGVVKISVRRLTPYPGNAGRLYDALTELREPEDLRRLFGGGTYEVWGRDSNGYAVKGARRKIMLDGQAIPMDRLDDPFRSMPQSAPQAPAAAPAASAAASSELDTLRQQVAALGQAMGQLAQTVQLSLQRPAAAPQDNGVLVALINGQSKMNETLLTALTTKTGDPAQTHEVFQDGMKSMADLLEPIIEKMGERQQAGEVDGLQGIAETVREVVAGMDTFLKIKQAKLVEGGATGGGESA